MIATIWLMAALVDACFLGANLIGGHNGMAAVNAVAAVCCAYTARVQS